MVTLDVSVVETKGHFLPGIPPSNFACWRTTSRSSLAGQHGRSAHDHRHADRVQQQIPAALGYDLVSNSQSGLGVCQHLEAAGFRGGHRLRYEAGDPFGFLHRPQQDPRSAAAADDSGLAGSQPVRRAYRYRGPHVRHRRAKGDSADLFRHRYLQQNHFRQAPQDRCRKPACRSTPSG